MRTNRSHLRSTVRSVPFAVAAALVLSGCSSSPFAKLNELQRAQTEARTASLAQHDAPPPPTQLIRPDDRDFVGGAAYWGSQYQANPDDIEAALNFSRNLRMIGGAKQSAMVMKELVMRQSGNARVLAEYGKALSASDRPQDAIAFLSQALQSAPNDWTILSARGVAYDQSGSHKLAQADYARALTLDDDNPTVMTNLAMSHVLEGSPAVAEQILQKVVARADATPTMRQNLAMVLAMQGKTIEATELGRVDLAPDDANSNAQLFAQFESPRVVPTSLPTPDKPPASAIVSPKLPNKIQAAVESDFTPVAAPPIATAISGDPMATPSTVTVTEQASASPIANQSPRQMLPVVDDTEPSATHAIAPKPMKKAISVATKAPTKLPTPKVMSNGETLITTINGIPVFGEAKPAAGKPEAGLLRPAASSGAL